MASNPKRRTAVWDRIVASREMVLLDAVPSNAPDGQVPSVAWVKDYVASAPPGGFPDIGDIDGLQAALDAKATTSALSSLSTTVSGKLDTSSYTAADVLTKVKTVDGTGSGLDADTVDGVHLAGLVQTSALGANSGVATLDSGGKLDPAQIPDLAIADVTGLQTAIDGKQALDATLTAFAALTIASGKIVYGTGSDAFAQADSTSYGRGLLNVADEAAFKAAVNLEIGTDVQAYHANLAALAGLSIVADRYIYGTGAGTVALGTITAFGRSLLDDADGAAVRTTIGAAAASHSHAQSDVTNLTTDLAAKAPLASPALTGTPTAPTAVVATDSTQIATTAFVADKIDDVVPAAVRLPDPTGLPDGKVPVVSSGAWVADDPPGGSGIPDPATGDEGDVVTVVSGAYALVPPSGAGLGDFSGPGSATANWPVVFDGTSGKLGKMPTDAASFRSTVGAAGTASPTFTGTPAAPTAAPGTDTTQLATTAFVKAAADAAIAAVRDGVDSGSDTLAELKTQIDGKAATSHAHDDRYYTESEADTLLNAKANLAGATDFTGNPIISSTILASTDSSTKIATTAWVQSVITALKNGVSTAFDTFAEVATEIGNINTALSGKAPSASPTLTGTVTVPTPSVGSDTTVAASTAFVWANAASAAEIFAKTAKKLLTAVNLWDAAAYVSLTDASTVTLNQSNGINFDLLATSGVGNSRTLGAMSNAKPGSSGVIRYRQDATGGRALVLTNFFKWDDETITIDTAANAVQHLFYFVDDASTVILSLRKKRTAIT